MIDITHTRVRWTSQKGVEFAPVDYTKYPASQGWTDIRHWEVDLDKYEMGIIIDPEMTISQFASESDAEVIMNGPFAYDGHAIGYIVEDGVLLNKNTSAPQWIDFIIRNGKADITQLDISDIKDIQMSFSATSEIVRDGKIYVNVHGEKTPKDVYRNKRARAGGGIKVDGKLLFCVVDGDSKGDAGLRLDELAAIMIRLGAKKAMNFDGGGSAAVAQNKKVISGNKGHRPLGSGLTFKPKKQSLSAGNPFADLPKYEDIRNTIRKNEARKYYEDVGIFAKTEVGIHHSLTDEGDAHSFANYHIDTHGWPGVAYAFVISKDGTIQHCNDISLLTYHVGDSNSFSIGICLVGDFRDDEPTKEQRDSLRLLHAVLIQQMPNYERTRGHNEYPGYAWKACPEFDYKSVIFGDPEPEQSKVLYRVQVGAFGVKVNAERLAAELKKAGYQTILKEEVF